MQSRIFIIIFSILTLLPGIQTMTGLIPMTAVGENRTLAPLPQLSMPIDRIPRAANDWFNDHFGFRPLLIRLKTQVDYSVFHTSDRVLVGSDGWLFYRSVIDVEEPRLESLLVSDKVTNIVRGMSMFTGALEKAGIRTALVINMMSDRFYGDKLPASAARRPAHPHIDDLVEKLRSLPSVRYIDSMAILRETMSQRQVFHKTDFHWNDPAAFEVAKAMVDAMSVAEGLPKSIWSHALEIELVHQSGGIATFMPLFVPPSEIELMVKPTFTRPPGQIFSSNVGIFEAITRTTSSAPGYLPSALFFGDSFLDGMLRSGLQDAFLATARARWEEDTKLSRVTQEIPEGVRWCIIQFIEVNLSAMNAFADLDDVEKAVAILERRAR
jgi:hypothetical protein